MTQFSIFKRLALGLLLTALVGFGTSITAKADLVQLTEEQLSGQGLGAVLTVLTLQSPANTTRESGGVVYNGTGDGDAFGDFSPPDSSPKNQVFTLADIGALNTTELALIVNLSEPGSENPPAVTTDQSTGFGITLTAYSSTGTVLGTFEFQGDVVLVSDAQGVGGSGLVFVLDAQQAAELQAIIDANPGYRLGVSATFDDATGGEDVIQTGRLIQETPVPEPASMLLLGTGLIGVAGMARRRFTKSQN